MTCFLGIPRRKQEGELNEKENLDSQVFSRLMDYSRVWFARCFRVLGTRIINECWMGFIGFWWDIFSMKIFNDSCDSFDIFGHKRLICGENLYSIMKLRAQMRLWRLKKKEKKKSLCPQLPKTIIFELSQLNWLKTHNYYHKPS